MWALKNFTPFLAERNWWLDKSGRKHWIVAVKGTFSIDTQGKVRIAREQSAPLLEPQYRGEPGLSSLLYESDLLGPKPGTDVLLNGRVHAPDGKPARQVIATLRVGALQKSIRAVGDRRWSRGLLGLLRLSSPKPFLSMPIAYELAYGGWDRSHRDPRRHRMCDRNPVGRGFAVYRRNLVGKLAPNLEHPKRSVRWWKRHQAPAGLGPLCGHWTPRREFAGTYDRRWQQNRFPLLPEDFEERYHCSAPLDQQSADMRGGEGVTLKHFTSGGPLTFELPRYYFRFTTRFGKESVEHVGKLQTVILEPDVPRVIMVWRTSLECTERADALDETVIRLKPINP